MNPITTSLFDLFKIGPGPSSSHTIGPMLAGLDFIKTAASLPDAKRLGADSIQVRLFGSLSATGKGHGTDRAVLAGLLGQNPETCESEFMNRLIEDPEHRYRVSLMDKPGHKNVSITGSDIIFDRIAHDFPYSNTMIIRLLDGGVCLFEREYYSVGGGFIRWKGQVDPEPGKPVFPYENMTRFSEQLKTADIPVWEMVLTNEQAVSGASRAEILSRQDRIMKVMEASVQKGLKTTGALPGPIVLNRKAPDLYQRALTQQYLPDRILVQLNAYALAVSEENAAGGVVVTAPTLGACGIIPALLYALKHHHGVNHEILRNGLLAAAAVGFIIKQNASISGAEVGCQGEVGAASAMGAALLCTAHGFGVDVMANAAEIALEHHLGLTCDPVMGYVQIPCIERNAMGAVKAYNAFLLASVGDPKSHKVGFDQAVEAMRETGKDMSGKYKETSQGGLALSMINC
jgi:L-serine dehydratase